MKCDIKTCQREATIFRSKKNNPKLRHDIIFCDIHAQVGRLIGAVFIKKSKNEIQAEMDKLIDLNKLEGKDGK